MYYTCTYMYMYIPSINAWILKLLCYTCALWKLYHEPEVWFNCIQKVTNMYISLVSH